MTLLMTSAKIAMLRMPMMMFEVWMAMIGIDGAILGVKF